MQFYFIRHAQSENNARWLENLSYQDRTEDPELTATGYEQARHLARYLSQSPPPRSLPLPEWNPQNAGGFGLTHIYCSLMVRAVATGTIVARALALPLVAWEDLHETGGILRIDEETEERVGLPGHNRTYFEAHYPGLILPEELGEEGWWNRPVEELEQRPIRARRVLEELLTRHGDSDDRVAVISHGGFFGHLMHIILDLPAESPIWFGISNTGITRIDFHEERRIVSYVNKTTHLPRELVT
jgi:2,3-bisphosphoglycerate-dependent phosphoglycerate mutase